MPFVPDTQQAPRFVPDEVIAPASTNYGGPVIQENPVWQSNAGGAAFGKPRMVDRTNIQAQPRPLESALAGMTKSAIDPLVASAQLVTGGNLGTSQLAQNLDKQADVYYDANPASYIAGRVGGAIAPASAVTKGAGMIPSFARANPMAQGAVLGATSGAMTPINTGATGGEMYGDVGQNIAVGTALGGAIPAVGQLSAMLRGKGPSPQMVDAITRARELGYVIPPTQANPSMLNRFMEGVAGKISTAQNASARNQEITNKLAAKSLGLADDTPITPQVLADLRTTAGNAYTNLGMSGQVIADKAYINALDDIAKPFIVTAKGFPNATPSPVLDLVESLKTPSFDATAAIEKVRQLRTAADDAFRNGNTDVARASKSAATAIENALEGHLSKTNQGDLLNKFRDARQLIAKTYSVEKAANPTTGTIDAKKLASQLQRGKPLSAELKDIAQFSQAFPKASQTTEAMGSLPQLSPLDYAAGLIGGVSTGGAGAGAILARPALRAAALSSPVQNRLIPNMAQPFLTPEQRNLARLLTLQGVQGVTNE
jgi:hypothetical protein